MKLRYAACAALLASLVLAPQALAHPNVTGSASQACDESTGDITLTASFSNEGFDTSVQATDSQAGDLGAQAAPATFTLTVPGPDRAAGTVSFNWNATDGDSGTVVAPYEAVSGCEAPPPTTTTTTTAPPPPAHHNSGGPPHRLQRLGSAPHGHSPRHPHRVAATPPGNRGNGQLPFSGYPLGALLLMAFGLVGGGIAIRKAHG